MAARSPCRALRLLWAAAFVLPAAAAGATKIGEGFATRLSTIGERLVPVNHVEKTISGGEIHHWVQWDAPVSRAPVRCVVKDSDDDVLLDETDPPDESIADGYSMCGYDTDRDFESGTYRFLMYVDGELASEQSLLVEKPGFFSSWKMSRRKQYKYMMGVLALVIIGVVWIRRKMAGDHKGAAAVFASDKAPPIARENVMIGSRLAGGGAAAAPAPASALASSAPPADPVADFKKRVGADPAYRLPPGEVLPVAKAARAAGDSQTAVSALRGFDKANPGHALIPDIYLFSAKLMAEDLGNKDMARKVLEHLIAKYPGHHLAQDARSYLKAMA